MNDQIKNDRIKNDQMKIGSLANSGSPIQNVTAHIQTITLDTGEVFQHVPTRQKRW